MIFYILTCFGSNGGQFEFLPVTLESASVSISAVLRVGVHCGIEVSQPEDNSWDILPDIFNITAGVEVAVFANVAEFVTNVTYVPEDEDCKLKVIQQYNLALGALAGVNVALGVPALNNVTWAWHPVVGTSTAIFTTILDERCAMQATSSAIEATTTAPQKREDVTTTILSSSTVTTGVSCRVRTKNCPNSEQVSTKATLTRYTTLTAPFDATPTFPDTVFTSIEKIIPFGSEAKQIIAMSGSPVAYVKETEDNDTLEGEIGGVSKKLIIGVSVGVGVPVLAILVGALW